MEQVSLVDLSLVFVSVNDHGVSCYPHFRLCIIYSSTCVASTGNADLFCFMVVLFVLSNNSICPIYPISLCR